MTMAQNVPVLVIINYSWGPVEIWILDSWIFGF